jgi:hypothetical protein
MVFANTFLKRLIFTPLPSCPEFQTTPINLPLDALKDKEQGLHQKNH